MFAALQFVRIRHISDEPLDVSDEPLGVPYVWNRAGSRRGAGTLYGY